MKILHVFDHSIPLHSGYSFRSQSVLLGQAAMGWSTCHVTSCKQGSITGLVEDVDGLRFYRTPSRKGVRRLMPGLRQWQVVLDLERRLVEVIAMEQPDLIHAHSPALNGMAALRAGRRTALPVVYECRAFWEDAAANLGTGSSWGLRYRLSRALESYVFRNSNQITCICEGLRQDILARGLDKAKVTVIPNAVDAERFAFATPKDEALAADLGLQSKKILGFIGSFYDYEGIDLAIAAMPRILDEEPDARLLLVGSGPRETAWRAQVEALSLGDKIRFTGRIAHKEIERFYSLIDILVYPRRSMRLTDLVTPLKPLEGMAQGKLVLASDVGGHRELIRDGETGTLFRAGNLAALADAVLGLLKNRGSWDQRRDAARRFVETERTHRQSVERYTGVYLSALKTREPVDASI